MPTAGCRGLLKLEILPMPDNQCECMALRDVIRRHFQVQCTLRCGLCFDAMVEEKNAMVQEVARLKRQIALTPLQHNT